MNHPSFSIATVAAGSALAGGMFACGQIAANPSNPLGWLAAGFAVAAILLVIEQVRRVR